MAKSKPKTGAGRRSDGRRCHLGTIRAEIRAKIGSPHRGGRGCAIDRAAGPSGIAARWFPLHAQAESQRLERHASGYRQGRTSSDGWPRSSCSTSGDQFFPDTQEIKKLLIDPPDRRSTSGFTVWAFLAWLVSTQQPGMSQIGKRTFHAPK